MASVTSFTEDRIQEIEDAEIVSGSISAGHVSLYKKGGGLVTVGDVTGIPPGTVVMFAAGSPPAGWVFCNGQALSRTNYADLFAVIGIQYGSGDGTTTFNVPNFEARLPRMEVAALAATAGSASHVHSGPSHVHAGPSHVHAGPYHSHNLDGGSPQAHARIYGGGTGQLPDQRIEDVPSWTPTHRVNGSSIETYTVAQTSAVKVAGQTVDGGNGDTGTSGTANTGSGGTQNTGSTSNLPPYLNINFIIKT